MLKVSRIHEASMDSVTDLMKRPTEVASTEDSDTALLKRPSVVASASRPADLLYFMNSSVRGSKEVGVVAGAPCVIPATRNSDRTVTVKVFMVPVS